MGISLTRFLELDDFGNPMKDNNGFAKFDNSLFTKPLTTFQEYLDALNFITSISANENLDPVKAKNYVKELTKLTLHKFQEHLEKTKDDWYGIYNPRMFTVVKQLESIAYLTGEREEIEKILNLEGFELLRDIKTDHQEQNISFIDNDDPLRFSHFDRNLLTVQLILRVLDPRFINQRNEQVCGVNGYIQNVALSNPLDYVKIVSKLALEGEIDLPGADPTNSVHIKISDDIANKKPSTGEEDIYDADHIILNGLRASENKLVSYSQEGSLFSKQLFGVTSHKEVNNWMTQSGYCNVQNIPIHDKNAVKQLQLLIKDGYMAGFAGTCTLADLIVGNIEDYKKQNLFKQFMDGHLFAIRNIEYIEHEDQNDDTIKIRIMTWGQEVEAEIPFKAWQENIGIVGEAIVGQPPYTNIIFNRKSLELNYGRRYCSPEAYCLQVKNLIEEKSNFEDIKKLLDKTSKHKDGQTWMDSAKKMQDILEALPQENQLEIPLKIAIIPSDLVLKVEEIEQVTNPQEKIDALEKLGTENNIEVQRQLVGLYIQEGQWEKVERLFSSVQNCSNTDKKIMYESLSLGCNKATEAGKEIPDRILASLFKIKANELISSLSEITGLPEGGTFTYGIKGRLLEVINKRHLDEGKDPINNLDNVILDKTDVMNLITLLDNEIRINDSSYLGENLEQLCNALIGRVARENNSYTPKEPSFYTRVTEFFLKVASLFSDNIITNKTQDFKNKLNGIKENPATETSDDIHITHSHIAPFRGL